VDGASIRAFRIEDMRDIMEVERQAFPKSPYPASIMVQYARNYPGGFVVVETGGEVAGYLIYDEHGGHVFSMAVKPSHRRKGLGRMMFMHARNNVEGNLWLEVRSKNTEAIRFYKRMGMKITERVPGYYETDDALVMVLEGEMA